MKIPSKKIEVPGYKPAGLRPRRKGFLACLAVLACAHGGCANSKYKLAEKGTPPPLLLNLTTVQAPVTATLNSVVVFRGPGSWKLNAYWDEYIVTVANDGGAPLVVESATLTDFTGAAGLAGSDPWLLDRQSIARGADLNRTSKFVLVQIGTNSAAYVATVTAVIAGSGPVGLLILPAAVVTNVMKNKDLQREVVAEFNRRRLALPITVAPRQAASGSVFFRISPGPQHLVLHCRAAGGVPQDITIALAPLAGLHLKPSR